MANYRACVALNVAIYVNNNTVHIKNIYYARKLLNDFFVPISIKYGRILCAYKL